MDVEQLLIDNSVKFRYAGKDLLVQCFNPEHDDRNPSMRIDRVTGLFHCFSCGFSGNIYKYYGLDIDLVSAKVIKVKDKIYKLMNTEHTLPLGREPFVRLYRNISPETYKAFNAFLYSADDYDDRINFPITDIHGKVVASIGRSIHDIKSKYKIVPSNTNLPLFPLTKEYLNISTGSIILVEGIFDVLNLWDKGIRNVVCMFGKNLADVKKRSKKEKALLSFLVLKSMGVTRITILLDPGAESSANNLKRLLEDHFIVDIFDITTITGNTKDDAGDLTKSQVEQLKVALYEESSNSR